MLGLPRLLSWGSLSLFPQTRFQVGALPGLFRGPFPVCCVHRVTHLPVHKDIDNGVVDGGTFGEVGWQGGHQRVEGVARVGSGEARKECVGPPAEAVRKDHHHHHAGYLLLRLPGGFGFFLLLRHLGGTESGPGDIEWEDPSGLRTPGDSMLLLLG